jgi:GntR family transcriptional regulator
VKNGIDRDSPEAYYLQLRNVLEQQIADGVYPAGSQIASETELCRSFGLSRATVREALRGMQERGVITIVRRRGAFVTQPKAAGWTLQSPAGFFEDEVGHHHRLVETNVLRCELSPLPEHACNALEVSHGTIGLVLERSRKLDGRIALFGTNYLRAELEPIIRANGIDRGHGSLNGVLKMAGYPVAGAKRSLESIGADAKVARILDLKAGAPVLLIHSASWDPKLVTFDFYQAWIRTDVVKIEINVTAAKHNGPTSDDDGETSARQ